MPKIKYDFAGWATRCNVKCADGRTIMQDAFSDQDGTMVPLLWGHNHKDQEKVLGHALLSNRPQGVYAYCKFNSTTAGQHAKELVKNNDINSLSIYANDLQEDLNSNVMHGAIREVSLVLAGANPEAKIDSVMQHGIELDGEAVIWSGDQDFEFGSDLMHSDLPQPAKTNDDEGQNGEGEGDETVKDVFDTLTDKQKQVVYALIGMAQQEGNNTDGGNDDMKHNLFDVEGTGEGNNTNNALSHDALNAAVADGVNHRRLSEAFIAHGITDIDWLFPEAKNLNNPPEWITRDMTWVDKIMKGVHHTPFSRIKSMYANLTADEARAKGYIKGHLKKEQVFTLLKRSTTPQTIYKKQKLDRDDVIDITDFDVISWIKGEMRMMLDEEIARAILIGDGRLGDDEDKINEQNIRPIFNDDDLYTIKKQLTSKPNDAWDVRAKEFIRTVIKSRKEYKGSGNPSLYTNEDVLTDCLLLEDSTGRRLYADTADLARTLRVSEIVTVEPMETAKGKNGGDLMGIIVNLSDYNVGADKGGAVNMFDDFDIDYNAMKYLIETRCSGALVKPYSAIAIETAKESTKVGA